MYTSQNVGTIFNNVQIICYDQSARKNVYYDILFPENGFLI